MNREDWETQVFESDLNPTARMICIAIGSHGNWEKSQTVWPSRQRIASMTGVSRDTVGKYMTALEEHGWLKVVHIRKDNVREYELSVPQVVVSYGNLAIKNRGSNVNQVVVDDGQVVVNYDKQVVVDDGLGCRKLRHEPKRTYQENLKEEPTNTSTAPAEAVQVTLEEEGLEKVTTTNLPLTPRTPQAPFNTLEVFEVYQTNCRYSNLPKEARDTLRDLMLDPTFEPEESRPNYRWALGIDKLRERNLV